MTDQRTTVPRTIPCEVDEGMPRFTATIISERFGETNWFREWMWQRRKAIRGYLRRRTKRRLNHGQDRYTAADKPRPPESA